MTVGFSLPTISPVTSSASDPSVRGSHAANVLKALDPQAGAGATGIMAGKVTGPTEVPITMSVSQPHETSAGNKIIRERPTDQTAISAANFEVILERAKQLRMVENTQVGVPEPLSLKAKAEPQSTEPSFANGLKSVRTMADPSGGEGESRLV